MVIGPDFTRNVRAEDYDAVEALLIAAFGGLAEAELVRRLRADGDMIREAYKPWGEQIVGYYALSRMRAPEGWACLAPVAVHPDWQNGAMADRKPYALHNPPEDEFARRPWRVGSRMMRELAELYDFPELRDWLPKAIVVLGKPSFYARAGFSQERARRLTSPYPVEYTLILKPGDDVPEETLVYPPAFSALD